MSTAHGTVALGDDGFFFTLARLDVVQAQLLTDQGDSSDPVDAEEQDGCGDTRKGDTDGQTDPEASETHVPLETEKRSDRQALRVDSDQRGLAVISGAQASSQ